MYNIGHFDYQGYPNFYHHLAYKVILEMNIRENNCQNYDIGMS